MGTHGGDGAKNPKPSLDVQHEAMKTFKRRVDALLEELDRSEAAPGKVGTDRLQRAQLGSSDFKEAQFLYDSYTLVHDELENLSKALSAQIEGMGLAVEASRVGYANLDEDLKARMRAINAQVERYYVPGRDPHAPRESATMVTSKDTSKDTEEW